MALSSKFQKKAESIEYLGTLNRYIEGSWGFRAVCSI